MEEVFEKGCIYFKTSFPLPSKIVIISWRGVSCALSNSLYTN